MPSPNNQDSMPQGGLSAAAAPAAPPPAAQPSGNPFGYNANPALMAAAMDPEKIMGLLKSNTVPDEDIRRHKFLAGLGAPTRSGSMGESFSNALGGLSDLEMDQKKLIAQYAPAMMQHMLGLYNASITGAEKQSALVNGWNAGLNSRVTSLLRSGAPVTPEVLNQVVDQAGTEFGVPSSYRLQYAKGLAGDAPNGSDISGSLKTRLLAGQKPEEIAAAVAPKQKMTDIGGKFVPAPENAQPGLTPPALMPQPLTKGPAPELVAPKTGTDKFGNATVDYKGQHATENTPEAQALWAQFKADQQAATGASGAQPAPTQGPPVPGQYPPGARSNIPLPPQGAPQAPQAPQGAPMQGVGGAQPKQIAPGAIAVPAQKPDPAFTPQEQKSNPLYGGQVQFTDVPTAKGLLTSAGGVNPLQEKIQTQAYDNFQKESVGTNQIVTSMQEGLRRGALIQQLAQKVRLGELAGVRESLSGMMQEIGQAFPGVSQSTLNGWADKIAGGANDQRGALAALEAMGKLSVSGAMVGLRGDIGSSAGQRIAMQEFLMYMKAVPNAEMNPLAVSTLREKALRDYMGARTEQDARASFLKKGEQADFGQFNSWWASKQDQLGYTPTNVNIGGGLGTGLPQKDVNFTRDRSGRIIVQDKDTKTGKSRYFLPNEQYLTTHW